MKVKNMAYAFWCSPEILFYSLKSYLLILSFITFIYTHAHRDVYVFIETYLCACIYTCIQYIEIHVCTQVNIYLCAYMKHSFHIFKYEYVNIKKYLLYQPQPNLFSSVFKNLASRSLVDDVLKKVNGLKPIADELGVPLAQLAIAWCAANPNVSSVITGATKESQVSLNLPYFSWVIDSVIQYL